MTVMLRTKNYHMLADEKTVTVLDGKAKFINNHQIVVTKVFINFNSAPIS